MRTFFVALGGAVIGALLGAVLLFFIASAVIGGWINSAGASLTGGGENPESTVLSIDLRDPLADQPATSGLGALFGEKGFVNVLTRLDAAKSDSSVKGVLIRASEYSVGSSRAEELRQAIHALRGEGKFVIVHSQGTYAGGPAMMRIMAAADDIVVQPGGDFLPGGITFETMFLKGLFDKLNVRAEIEQFYEYKNAPNVYKQTDFTDAHLEAMTVLAESLWETTVADIAEDRGLTVQAVKDAFNAAPLSPDRLIELGLATELGWPEDAMDTAKERGGEGTEIIDIMSYSPPTAPLGTPAIAIVGGEGPIVTGGSDGDFFSGGAAFASDAIAGAILEAGRNERVKAIVFRVDSPGGSPTASDQIWRAVERVQEMDKPVVVSMGAYAASGGYYVSTGADWIVANRTTITGSIGIFGGKFALADGLRQIGVNTEAITVGGPFAGALTTLDGFTEEQRSLLHAWLERGYDRFISLVAEGRDMSEAEVREIAKGRVWTGEDGLEVGIVDQLGGLMDALAKARELAGIGEDEETRIMFYPVPQGGLPGLGPMAESSAGDLATLSRAADILENERIQMLIEQGGVLSGSPVQARGPAFIER
ncbi:MULTISPECIES: signal peptide peptidase SppA [Henriciella]|uniref:signal peptide peptidase SppA n=1 Tax=Henriciella TaxID=453849 RepID=UPI000A00728C|nr:signal peptide peptidase SppA [Henriciella pelagia]